MAARQPRFVAVQAAGCAPVVKGWAEGAATTTAWEDPVTEAAGLRVPSPFAGRQMLAILRETGGRGVAVSEAELVEGQRLMARLEGIWTCPEAGAAVAALARMKADGLVDPGERVVLMLTGAGIKYAPPRLPTPAHVAGPEELLDRLQRAVA
jgi:threonine synthase